MSSNRSSSGVVNAVKIRSKGDGPRTRFTSNGSRRAGVKRIAKALRGCTKPGPSPKSTPTSARFSYCVRCGREGLVNIEGVCTGIRFVMTADVRKQMEPRSKRCDFIVDSLPHYRVASPALAK